MNEKHRRLYDDMIRYQMIPDKSYEEWTLNFSTPQKQKELYDFLSTTKVNRNGQEVSYFPEGATPEAFYENIFNVKKKDQPQVLEPALEEVSTVSTSDTTQVAEAPSGDLDLQVTPKTEKQYFTSEFGDQINNLPIFGDVIDDIGRAYGQGAARRGVVEATFAPIVLKTSEPSEEQIALFVDAVNQSDALTREYGQSDEMMDFQKTYMENGEGVWGFLSGVAQNPGILPEVLVQSYSTMANEESAKAALEAFVAGGAAGTVVPGAGTAAGVVAATPLAFGSAGAVMESSLSFVEFLKEELGEQEFSLENVSQVLSDPEKLSEMRRRSLTRGGTIGVVDALGGAVLSKTIKAAKTLGKVQKAAVGIAGGAVTGGTGEAAARALVGQEMDVAEIGLEAAAGTGQAPITLGQAAIEQRLENVEQSQRAAAVDALNESLRQSVSPASYKLNGESVTKDQLNEMLNVLTDEDLKKVNIEVENDAEVQEALEDRTRSIAINDIIPQEVQGEDRSRIVTLEKELQKFEGKPTETAKKRASQIKSEISEILDKYQVAPEAEPTAEAEVQQDESDVQRFADTKNRPLREKVKNKVDEVADGPGPGFAMKWFNPVLMQSADITSDAEIKEYYIQSLESGQQVNERSRAFLTKEFERLGIDPDLLEAQVAGKNKKLNPKQFDLFEEKETGKRYRKIGQSPDERDESVSLFVEEGQDIYIDEFGIQRPSETEKNRLLGINMRDEMMSLVEEGDPEAAAPAEPTAEPTAEPEPTVEPTAEPEVTPPAEPQQTGAQRLQRLKDEGVYIREEGLKSKVISAKQRFFAARKHLPKNVFRRKEKKEALIAKQLNIVEQQIGDFNRIQKNLSEDAKDQFLLDFDGAITGNNEALERLSDDAKALAISLRNNVDRLTKDLITTGVVPAEDVAKFESNLGKYLTRSYKVYDRPNWKNQVEEEVIQAAKNQIMNSEAIQKQAEREVNTDVNLKGLNLDEYIEFLADKKVEEYLNPKDVKAFAQAGMGKDLSILKPKQDIPVEIRALMGEYTNPIQNYVKSVMAMVGTVETQRYLNDVAKLGKGLFLEDQPTGIFDSVIEGTGSDLDGKFTTKEIADEFMTPEFRMPSFLAPVFALSTSAKYTKTILSVGTHSKNILGNGGIMYANGHLFNPRETVSAANTAYQTIKNDLKIRVPFDVNIPYLSDKIQKLNLDERGGDNALNQRMNEYIGLGIVKQSASIGELRAMFKDANYSQAVETRLNNESTVFKNQDARGAIRVAANIGAREVRSIGRGAEYAYQSEDDFFKIVAFEIDKSRYSEALFNKPKDELTESESKELDEYVAEIVKNTYPTYSRVPLAVQLIRQNPAIGNFVSFQAESYRCGYNTLMLGVREMNNADGNAKLRSIGASRVIGSLSYMGLKTAVASLFSYAAGAGVVGGFYAVSRLFDDEEEKRVDAGDTDFAGPMGDYAKRKKDQRLSDMRRFSPYWTENCLPLILRFEDGRFDFIDLSSSDPYGNIDRITNSLFEADSPVEGIGKGLYQVIEPFVGAEIAAKSIGGLIYNQDASGNQIMNRSDTPEVQMRQAIDYVYKSLLEPGTFKSIRKVLNSDRKVEEFVGQFTGLKPYRIDVRKQLVFKVIEAREAITEAKKIRREKSDDALERANQQTFEKQQILAEDFYAAERLGVPYTEIKKIAVDLGLSEKAFRDIYNGKQPNLQPVE